MIDKHGNTVEVVPARGYRARNRHGITLGAVYGQPETLAATPDALAALGVDLASLREAR